ncbi:LysR family transcriptional regulator [Actinokineospora diospyrosa]|uniref:DNA-binding transcriptional regulator, LysR family n=1 Tax=Actinokineospora diospyrosa TaxID=103728 RepID=A0ABT1ICL6_9PSEU|nr:LysR family transcriptional regulator [Actinokineospora diospyrosa]MCP2270106.1 DNA-binding transcriptional regulator, LysR family [Actinokineospora diospyrosa]
MDLEIRHLRALAAIADSGSLSRAATVLGISQPSLTTLLQRVERAVGGRLFERSRTGMAPTALGERVLRRTRPLLAELTAISADLAGPGEVGAVRIGSVHMECVTVLYEHLDQALPEAEVTFTVEPSCTELVQSLVRDGLDLAVLAVSEGQDVPIAPELGHRVVVPRVPVFVALSAEHRLAKAAEISLAELADEAWINPPGPEDGALASFRAAARRAGFTPRIRFEVPSGGGRGLIAAARAVQLVEPTSPGVPGIAVRPLVGDPMRMRLSLVWHRHRIGRDQVDRAYRAVASVYTRYALASPAFRPWWERHREVHPLVE